jgi:hypothetical protein
MNLIELINQELGRGFTKSELERIWDLPKNSLSAILNPDNKAKLSKKAEIRVKTFFELAPADRPHPEPKIRRGKPVSEKFNETSPILPVYMPEVVEKYSVDEGKGVTTKLSGEGITPITKSDKIDFLTS